MAYTTYGNPAANASSLSDRVAARIETIKQDWAKWRLYRRTFNELNALSARDLDDLGLNRSSIRAVALEAAYGK